MKLLLTLSLMAIPSAWGSTLPIECQELLSEGGVVAQWTEVQDSPQWVQSSLSPSGWHEGYIFASTTVYGRAPAFGFSQAIAFNAKRKFEGTRKPQLDRELHLEHLKSGEFQRRITQHLTSRPTLLCGILGGEISALCSLVATVNGTVSIPVGLALVALSEGCALSAAWLANSEVIRRDYVRLPEQSIEEMAGAAWRVRQALLFANNPSPLTERFVFSESGHFLFVETDVPKEPEKEVQMNIFWAAPAGQASGG